MRIPTTAQKTSLWTNDNQEGEIVLGTPEMLAKATATIKTSLGLNDPSSIWAAVGLYLEKLLSHRTSVNISDFGLFTFSQHDDPIFVQNPVFLHTTRLCLASRKSGDRETPTLLSLQTIQSLNVKELAATYLQTCSLDLIQAVISNVFAWVRTWAKAGRDMQLSFSPVGQWHCIDGSVNFHFSDSFCHEFQLRKEHAARPAEGTICSNVRDNKNNNNNNKLSDVEDECDRNQSAISPQSAQTLANLSISSFQQGKSSGSTSSVRGRSSTDRPHGEFRAPTRSSMAKQVPPQGPKRVRTEAILAAMKTGRIKTASTCRKEKSLKQPTPKQVACITRLRERISNRNPKTIQGLNALMGVFRTIKAGVVSPTELSLLVRKLGVKLSVDERKEMAAAFGHQEGGSIDMKTFFNALRGPPLSASRLELVTRAFAKMDSTKSQAVPINELIKHYDVSFLPQVRDGKQSRWEAIAAFLKEWTWINPAIDNTITFDMFVEYYHNVSACMSNDTDFARLMHQAWQVPEKKEKDVEIQTPLDEKDKDLASSANDSLTLSVSTRTDEVEEISSSPRKTWSYLRALLLHPQLHSPSLDQLCRRLGANRVLGDENNETMNVKAFAHALIALDKRLSRQKASKVSAFVATTCAKRPHENDTIVLLSLYRMLMALPNETTNTQTTVDCTRVEHFASRALEKIRARVRGLSASNCGSLVDLETLEKWLKASSDSNGDACLLKYELRRALLKLDIDISYQDLDYLFAYFDDHHQGFINYETFLETLRRPSKILLKRTKRPEASSMEEQPVNSSVENDTQQLDYLAYPVTAPQPKSRPNKRSTRKPPPDFRRRNHIHRAIWNHSKDEELTGFDGESNESDTERRRRFYAALAIQIFFRGFRARQRVRHLRRKQTATYSSCSGGLLREQQQRRASNKVNKVKRTALRTTYGF